MNEYSFFNQITLTFLTCRMCFMLVLKLFTSFDTFPIRHLLGNVFDTSKKDDVIGLKGLYSFIFKV